MVAADQGGHGPGEFLGEGRPGGRRGEPHLGVDAEVATRRSARETLVSRVPTSCASREPRASSQWAESWSGDREGSGLTAARTLGEIT